MRDAMKLFLRKHWIATTVATPLLCVAIALSVFVYLESRRPVVGVAYNVPQVTSSRLTESDLERIFGSPGELVETDPSEPNTRYTKRWRSADGEVYRVEFDGTGRSGPYSHYWETPEPTVFERIKAALGF